jgi:hypothetical protein
MPTDPIIAETIAGIQRTLGGELDHLAIERAVFGRSAEKVVLMCKMQAIASCAA